MKDFIISVVVFLGTSPLTLAIPTWPSPAIDELEDIRFLMSGYLRRGFSDFVTPCSFSAAGNARVTAAEWIRTAYHDMSTADVVAGTGGLDASISFETDRSENIGAAFNSTFASILPYYTYRSSMADLIALTVLTSVSACGGPTIPYRTGRIDATEAGPTGVPEPSDDLTTISEKFTRQGFNTSDMITLVACGHTIGGVHGEDFPTIVVDNGTSGSRFSHFDSTVKFDNIVATEYITGNTTNPLVVGPDASNRSDQIVFSSDGNITMNLLMDPVTFRDRCGTVLQKMIDTVPSNVVLTDPLEAYEIKPAQLKLKLSTDGSNITFSGAIRVRTTVRPVANIAYVTLLYASRDGLSTGTINTTKATFQGGSSSGFTETFYWYEFSTQLSANTSISSFNVTAALNDGSVENHDNNGVGFPVQSNIMLQVDSSCKYYNATGDSFMKIVAAVHNSRSSKNVNVVSSIRTSRQGTLVPGLDSKTDALTLVNSTGPYDIYAATVKLTAAQTTTTYIDLVSGADDDKEVNLFKNINGWNACTD